MSYLETPKEIVRALERDVEKVCRELLPNGKRDGAEWCVGSVQGEPGQSFRVRLTGDKAGLCKEFDGDEKGFDLLHLWCSNRGIGLRDAMREARTFLGLAQPPELKKPKTYAKPKRPSGSVMAASKTDSPVVAYFKQRGITEDTLKAFHVLEQPNSFHGHPDNPADIVFPYLRKKADGKLELINNKYLALKRTPNADGSESKLTRLEKDCQLALFGWHLIAPTERKVVITEGECFPGDAQVLTDSGWVNLEDYRGGAVAQWFPDRSIQFVYPLAKIERDFDGKMIEHSSGQFYSLTTPDHNLISINKKGGVYKHAASVGPESLAHKIPRCGILDGMGIGLTDAQIALCLAISADAAIDVRKMSHAGGAARVVALSDRYARFAFKRHRKIKRLESILDELGIKASNNMIHDGYRSICFGVPKWVPGRLLPWEWIRDANARQREFILSELVEWDGNRVPNRTMTEYASKLIENAEWVQAMAHLSGKCSTVVKRSNAFGRWFKTTILNSKKESSWQTVKTREIDHSGKVYCLQVPSGALVVRQKGVVSISGNCDAMTLHQLGFAALSSPNGCGGLTWLEDEYPALEQFDEIYVCFDMDEPGRKGAHALIERLGRHRCKLVSLPHKDANECLQKGVTLPEFIACFRAAESLRPDELLRFDELIDQVKAARQQQQANGGVPTGLMLPWAKANRFWFQPGKMTMISGYSGHGKTTMYSHVIAYAIAQGERWCIASLEMSGAETVERLSRQLAGKSALNDYQLDNLGAWVGDRCLIYDHLGQANLKAILDVFTYSARRYGCTQFCLDSLMMLGVGHEDYDRQQAVVSELLAFARTHHAHIHLIHHPRKPANDDSAPNRYDIKGTGGLTDMVPNVLIAWRNRKKDDAIEQAKMTGIPPDPMLLMEPDATLKIDKNRLNGWEPTLQLWFDADSQQYLANQGDLPVVYAPCTLATGPINPPNPP